VTAESGPTQRRRRWWLLLALPLLLAVAGYVAFPYLLDSALLKRAIAGPAGRLRVDWDSLRMTRLGQFDVRGLEIQADSRSMQWRVALDRALVGVELRGLLDRRFATSAVKGAGLDFQLRRKPTAEKPADSTHLPPMPGLELTARRPRPARRRPPGWRFAIHGVDVTDLREIWVDAYRLNGSGSVRGGIETQVRGPFSLDDLEVSFTDASLLDRGELVAQSLALGTRLDLEPSLPAELRTVEALTKLDGELRVTAESGALGFLQPLFHRAGVRLHGTDSRLDADLRLVDGQLQPGSRFDVASGHVVATFPAIGVEGGGEIHGSVDDTGLAVKADLPLLDLVVHDQKIGEAKGFEMTVRSENPVLSTLLGPTMAAEVGDANSEVAEQDDGPTPVASREEKVEAAVARAADAGVVLEVALADGSIHDLRPLADLFPPSQAFRFTGGAAHLAANANLRVENGAASIHLRGDDVGLTLMDQPLLADVVLELEADSRDPRSRWFDVRKGSLALNGVKWSGEGGEGDWSARLALRNGRIRLTKPVELVADLGVQMSDTRPFVQMLAQEHKTVRWFKGLLNIKNVAGGAQVALDEKTLRLRQVAIDGQGMMIRAQMDLHQPPDALMLVGLHGLRAGFALDAGKRELQIRKPREWYDERAKNWKPIHP
jgi:hypothetical protein